MSSTPVAFPTGSEDKVEESSWGVIAALISLSLCWGGCRAGGGTGSGEPSVVWMWEARHSTFSATVVRGTPLLAIG